MNTNFVETNNSPKATLVSYMKEREALSMARWAADAMHNNVGDDYMAYCSQFSDDELRVFWTRICNDGLATPLEYIPMIWKISNVSRALQQQITRYRVGISFCIESMRVVDKKEFAQKYHYHIPKSFLSNKVLLDKYTNSMLNIEKMYNELLD